MSSADLLAIVDAALSRIDDGEDHSTPYELARQHPSASAALIVLAGGPWSPEAHDLFPAAARERAKEVLRPLCLPPAGETSAERDAEHHAAEAELARADPRARCLPEGRRGGGHERGAAREQPALEAQPEETLGWQERTWMRYMKGSSPSSTTNTDKITPFQNNYFSGQVG